MRPGHLPESRDPNQVIDLHSLHKDSDEADKGELHEGKEHQAEAEHHVQVQRGDPAAGARLA